MKKTAFLATIVTLSTVACRAGAPEVEVAATSDSIPLVEEMRLGGLVGDIEYTFGSVTTLAPAPDGSFYVADRQGPVLRKYDSTGQHLFDVARSGEGPGEFMSIDGLAILNDERVVVFDGRNARISYFSSDGTFQTSLAVRNGLGGWRGFGVSPEGDAFVRVLPEGGEFVESRDGIQSDWARIGSDGAVTRISSIAPERRVGPFYVLSGRGGYYYPFVSATLNAIGPDGSYYEVRNDDYSIRRVHPDGSETTIVRDEPLIRLTSDELKEWEARSETFAARNPDRRSDYFPIPETKPFIREIVVDPDGRLWVSRYTEAAFLAYTEAEEADRMERNLTATYNWRDRLRWDVFDADDRFLGFVTLPFKTSFVTAVGDQVWGVQSGDYREDYVVQFTMGPTGG